MTGQIKAMIDRVIEARSKGNPTIVQTTKTKLAIKGINPDNYTSSSPDDPAVLARLREIAAEMGITV